MPEPITRRRLAVTASDGARAELQLHLPASARIGLYWLPALGVGIGPNETLADCLAARGIAVAIHDWRGQGSSDRRASRGCDWGYRELLEFDIAAGVEAARAQQPDIPWLIGGHSLGGQFALIESARLGGALHGALLVASGHPYWRRFPGFRAGIVRAFAAIVPLATRVCGYFPGQRLGFAGREAARLMREWAATAVRGDYRVPYFGGSLNIALAAHSGQVLALRLSQDILAPPGSIEHLREMTPAAHWDVRDLDQSHFQVRRPDHFGWLREPEPIADALDDWLRRRVPVG